MMNLKKEINTVRIKNTDKKKFEVLKRKFDLKKDISVQRRSWEYLLDEFKMSKTDEREEERNNWHSARYGL
jgi:hypothetical protein